MPEGLQVRNAAGALILDLNSRLGRILGSVTIGATTGTTGLISGAEQGELFWTLAQITFPGTGDDYDFLWDRPDITVVTGNEIQWSWPGGSNIQPHTLFYGVR